MGCHDYDKFAIGSTRPNSPDFRFMWNTLLFLSKLNDVCEFVNTFRNETPIESRIPFQAIVSNVHQPLENLLRLRQNYADTLCASHLE
jgi:hypothetical protein